MVSIVGSYIIIENIKFGPENGVDSYFGLSISEGNHHIAVRNCEFSGEGNLNKAGGIGIGTWAYSGSNEVAYIFLDKLDMHDLGDIDASFDQDKHCVNLNGTVNHLWLTNSLLTRCSGDGIQIEAQQGRRDKIHHIYVGKNISHDNKQSGMWIKHATDVIFSQNTIYGHRRSDSSAGQGTGFQYGPDYVWFINNTIYDNSIGIFVASNDPPGDGTEAYFIGNLIYNIHNPQDPENPYNSGCFSLRGSTNRYIINNTCYDYDSGINGLSASGKYVVVNNIFSKKAETSSYDIYFPNQSALNSILRNNIFFNDNGLKINWNGSVKTTLESLKVSYGEGIDCLFEDPKFIDPLNHNFMVNNDSKAIDLGNENIAYDVFFSRYGIDIKKDIENTLRPQGIALDAGAYEKEQAPAPPKNLKIK